MADPIQGSRRQQFSFIGDALSHNESGFQLPLHTDLAEGEYGLHEVHGWHAHPPGLAHSVDLGAHVVTEHDDLTITVDGELHLGGPLGTNGPMFHGALAMGEWLTPQES